MDTTKATLKNEIKKYTREGYAARKAIQAASGLERDAAWGAKRAIGAHARHRLLAYALYRGMPYRVLESRCAEDIKSPYEKFSAGRLTLAKQVLAAIHQALPEAMRTEWVLDQVLAWMAPPAQEKVVPAALQAAE